MIDTTLLGETAAKLMDTIGEDIEEGTISEVAIVVEVHNSGSYEMYTQCTDERSWVQEKLLEEGIRITQPSPLASLFEDADEDDE